MAHSSIPYLFYNHVTDSFIANSARQWFFERYIHMVI